MHVPEYLNTADFLALKHTVCVFVSLCVNRLLSLAADGGDGKEPGRVHGGSPRLQRGREPSHQLPAGGQLRHGEGAGAGPGSQSVRGDSVTQTTVPVATPLKRRLIGF